VTSVSPAKKIFPWRAEERHVKESLPTNPATTINAGAEQTNRNGEPKRPTRPSTRGTKARNPPRDRSIKTMLATNKRERTKRVNHNKQKSGAMKLHQNWLGSVAKSKP
jgi:hypothetical protein